MIYLHYLACNVKWLGLRRHDVPLLPDESLVPLKPKDLQIAESLMSSGILEVNYAEALNTHTALHLLAYTGVLISDICSPLSVTSFLCCFSSCMTHFGTDSFCDFVPFGRFLHEFCILRCLCQQLFCTRVVHVYTGAA